MTAWNNMKIGTKLMTGFGVILIVFAVVGTITLRKATVIASKEEALSGAIEHLHNLLAGENAQSKWVMSVGLAIMNNTAKAGDVVDDPTRCEFYTTWLGTKAPQELVQDLPEAAESIKKIDEAHKAFHASLRTLMEKKGQAGAESLEGARQYFLGTAMPLLDQVGQEVIALQGKIERYQEAQIQNAISTATALKSWTIYLLVIAMAAGILMGIATTRSIAPPLRVLVQLADEIAEGRLEPHDFKQRRTDEIGALFASFGRMHAHLLGTARNMQRVAQGDLQLGAVAASERDVMGNALVAMNHDLRELASALIEGANNLAAASAETAASSAQLSTSTSETAAAISETTATMEEICQTADMMTLNAGSVADNARQGSVMAEQCMECVQDIMAVTRNISGRMDFIAQNAVQLSEKTHKIGDIIAVVNDIADQSNILAINASIEAVKAGDTGKGFMVLAEEIRNLAEQSKQATKEIKAILDDIQKASTTTVMATEEGSKATLKGEDQAKIVSKAIMNLANGVNQSSKSAEVIALSAKEQLKGMEQVTKAMENIHTAGMQNKASASQLTDTSQSLKRLSQNLVTLVGRFKL